jgi:acetyl-CoA/propionyl-CoA carboxylase biotin carboxyl carrier protein
VSATDSVEVSVLGEPGAASVVVGDALAQPASLTSVAGRPNAVSVEYAGRARIIDVVVLAQPGGDTTLHLGESGVTIDLVQRSRARQLADELERNARPVGQASPDVRSPMPGTVIAVHVASGDRVESGQLLLTVEAMKMEHKLAAPTAGVVRISLAAGGLVALDQVVATIEPEPEPEPDPAKPVKGDTE